MMASGLKNAARGKKERQGEKSKAEFFSVSPLMLFPETFGNFSVYLRQGKGYVLYTDSRERFSEKKKQTLYDNGVKNVFVEASQKESFEEYIEDNLALILENEGIPLKERSRVFYSTSVTIMKNVFDDRLPAGLNKNFFNRLSKFIRNSIGFLCQDNSLKALSKFISHDYKTFSHCVHVYLYALPLLSTMGLSKDDLFQCGVGAMLHDVGKTRIPKEIINKPGKLEPHERVVIETHPTLGVSLCANLQLSQLTLNCILFHHEKENGAGYPARMAAEDIPVPVKAISIADAFDAMTTDRPYAKAKRPYDALSIMRFAMDGSFDLDLYKQFVRILSGAEIV